MRQLTQEQLMAAGKAARSNVPHIEGVMVDSFNLLEVAQAIEGQIRSMGNVPNRKITIHMDAHDADEFARAFRKLALLR